MNVHGGRVFFLNQCPLVWGLLSLSSFWEAYHIIHGQVSFVFTSAYS